MDIDREILVQLGSLIALMGGALTGYAIVKMQNGNAWTARGVGELTLMVGAVWAIGFMAGPLYGITLINWAWPHQYILGASYLIGMSIDKIFKGLILPRITDWWKNGKKQEN